ncbi:hypothetical protein NLG97_g2205 [Lecanicillium saksenae]|uniref:Uncharacterized protein n=1 Tax=Lecanicillium saksenae TaxID=468837 RepID=A0ACC1R1L3_9HYPO|nr:hypothetical protein NLG97_g2205 [Lecanicillium saksenae]
MAFRKGASNDALLASEYIIGTRFPRDATISVEEATPSQVLSLIGVTENTRSMVVVHVQLPRPAIVTGFGVPVANPTEPELESWVNDPQRMPGGHTLAGFLSQHEFTTLLPLALATVTRQFRQSVLPPLLAHPCPAPNVLGSA